MKTCLLSLLLLLSYCFTSVAQSVLPKEDNAEETVKLGRDAIALLVTVCNASGILQISTSLESYSILIDCNNFVDCSSLDNRTIARWKEALKKLQK